LRGSIHQDPRRTSRRAEHSIDPGTRVARKRWGSRHRRSPSTRTPHGYGRDQGGERKDTIHRHGAHAVLRARLLHVGRGPRRAPRPLSVASDAAAGAAARNHDWQPLQHWFWRWFKENAGEHNEALVGAVHFLSDPEVSDGTVTFAVDLGTAPVEAFED